jgi:hypothetical protein
MPLTGTSCLESSTGALDCNFSKVLMKSWSYSTFVKKEEDLDNIYQI